MDEEVNPLIKQIDAALQRYYKLQETEYKNEDGIGLFEAYCNDNGLDDDGTIEEELDQADPDECLLIDFDENIPGVANDDKKAQKVFRILRNCAENETAYRDLDSRYTALTLKPRDWKICERDINQIVKIYRAQCPKIFDGKFEQDRSLLKTLCVGQTIDKPYLQILTDCYHRERVETKDKLVSYGPAVWALSNKHCKELRKWKDSHRYTFSSNIMDKSPLDDTRIAVTSYFHRICPQLMFRPPRVIIDSLSQTCEYIAASIFFVAGLAKDTNKTCPFQFDVTIAFNKTKKGTEPYNPHRGPTTDSDSDSDSDNDNKNKIKKEKVEDIHFDVFGNVKEKFENEKLLYLATEINDKNDSGKDKDIKIESTKAARMFYEQFRKFKNNKLNTKYCDLEFEEYPRKHRFCAFIDRREVNDSNYDDMKDKGISKNDEVIFYEPPNNCNTFPAGKVVPLWHFNTLAECVIPNKGYNNGKGNIDIDIDDEKKIDDENNQKEKLLNETITCESHCNGAIMILSFHVENQDEIKCYLYMNGQVLRFLADDVLNVLPEFFDKEFGDNEKFPESKQARILVKQMNKKLKDIALIAFLNATRATVDEINDAKTRYNKFVLY